MRCSFPIKKNIEITIRTSECMRAVYININQKMKTFVFVNTVSGNKEGYSNKHIKAAD